MFRAFFIILLVLVSSGASALFVSEPIPAQDVLSARYPNAEAIASTVTNAQGKVLPYWHITSANETLAYAFETDLIHRVPAYSGEPVNMLVFISPEGNYLHAKVLEHHEPILLVGIPETKLHDFTDQYEGLSLNDRIKVGGNQTEGQIQLDGLSGATVTVMVMNVGITRGATELARALGIIADTESVVLPARIIDEIDTPLSWLGLTGEGSVRRMLLKHQDIDEAFAGTMGEGIDEVPAGQKQESFTDIYYTLIDLPAVGKNILGADEYAWLKNELKPGEHVLALFGNGYSYKGSGYVRGGIFDRIQLLQNDLAISFRDLDYIRLQDIYLTDAPSFQEMSMFIIREHHGFDPGQPFQFELLVRRQLGAIDSVFTSFKGDYEVLETYLDRPEPPVVEPERTLVEQVWFDKRVEVVLLVSGIVVLLAILFFQDVLVRMPTFLHKVRTGYLIYTVLFIGWYCAGQISIVNVFTFLQAFMSDFEWQIFLLDPVIFIMWIAVAVTALLWGRGVFCGWLCPFGALQELINHVARKFKVPQYELPFAVQERLWAVKYLILLGLFGLSIQSLALAEQYAEIEPFKTTFLLKFSREWGFVLWASVVLATNVFQRKTFCRYLCPLGAALSVPTNLKLFNWLKRRDECGKPCRVCANECEIQAIEPDGTINQRECHYCLDCQMTYFNEHKCPPLVQKAKKEKRRLKASGKLIDVTEVN